METDERSSTMTAAPLTETDEQGADMTSTDTAYSDADMRYYDIVDGDSHEVAGTAPGPTELGALHTFNRDACNGEGEITGRTLAYRGMHLTALVKPDLIQTFANEGEARTYIQANAHRPGHGDDRHAWGPALEPAELRRLDAAYSYVETCNAHRQARIAAEARDLATPDLELVEAIYFSSYKGDCNPDETAGAFLGTCWAHAYAALDSLLDIDPDAIAPGARKHAIATRVADAVGILYGYGADPNVPTS